MASTDELDMNRHLGPDTGKATARFRFYAELNDFVSAARRGVESGYTFSGPAPVRHLIETLGVPHTEVELVLVNGRSVSLEQRVCNGDRISVYPVFETFDVAPLLKIRSQPLRRPRFLADTHLGRLAGYLRMLGFDTRHGLETDDGELVARSLEDERILLTRDRALLMHRGLTHGCYIRSQVPRMQLAYLLRRLDLARLIRPFSRCMRCNGLLERVSRETVLQQLPERVRRTQTEFKRCTSCAQVYWRGGHYRRMQLFIRSLIGEGTS